MGSLRVCECLWGDFSGTGLPEGSPPPGGLIYTLAADLTARHPYWRFARAAGPPRSPDPGDSLLVDTRDGRGYRPAGPVVAGFVIRALDDPALRALWGPDVAPAVAALIEAGVDRRARRRRRRGVGVR